MMFFEPRPAMTALNIGLLLTTLMERSASRGLQRLTFSAIVAPFLRVLFPAAWTRQSILSMPPSTTLAACD
jgi:hypothetical protein